MAHRNSIEAYLTSIHARYIDVDRKNDKENVTQNQDGMGLGHAVVSRFQAFGFKLLGMGRIGD